jgi:hypothetical protein
VRPGVNHGAHLANQNIARQHLLAVVPLDPTPLPVGVAAVSGASLTFFMCHEILAYAALMAVIFKAVNG